MCTPASYLHNNTLILLLEPSNGVFLGHQMMLTNSTRADLTTRHTVTGSDQYDKEIHTENTSVGIILQTQINVFGDTETKASSIREVLLLQLVFLYLQTTIKDFVSLETTDLHTANT